MRDYRIKAHWFAEKWQSCSLNEPMKPVQISLSIGTWGNWICVVRCTLYMLHISINPF